MEVINPIYHKQILVLTTFVKVILTLKSGKQKVSFSFVFGHAPANSCVNPRLSGQIRICYGQNDQRNTGGERREFITKQQVHFLSQAETKVHLEFAGNVTRAVRLSSSNTILTICAMVFQEVKWPTMFLLLLIDVGAWGGLSYS